MPAAGAPPVPDSRQPQQEDRAGGQEPAAQHLLRPEVCRQDRPLPEEDQPDLQGEGRLLPSRHQALVRRHLQLVKIQLFKMSDFFTVTVSDLLTVRLSYCKTVSLSDFQTIGLLDCLTVLLSYCHNIILSDCKTVSMFDCQTVRVSDCQTV